MAASKVLIIGVGNEYRCDDAVGLVVARELKAGNAPNVSVIEESGEGSALMEVWKNAETVILIDAVSSGAPPGTVQRFEAHAEKLPMGFFHYSTHAFGIAEAIELSRVLQQLPPRMTVYGIEGKNFASGSGLSAEVKQASDMVVKKIVEDLNHAKFRA